MFPYETCILSVYLYLFVFLIAKEMSAQQEVFASEEYELFQQQDIEPSETEVPLPNVDLPTG